MAFAQVLLSPAELAYLHSTLSLPLPIRPDGRSPTQFRPLTAETGILPGTNGSARICFADGTEAIVGIKAEIAKTVDRLADVGEGARSAIKRGRTGDDLDDGAGPEQNSARNEWLEITVEIPGFRDDDPTTVFLGSMLSEALLADKEFAKKLFINRRFHWRLYLDIFLISQQLSYPLPLLSLTTHLALLATRLPRLKSEGDEDPMFDDDWEASTYIYPRDSHATSRPPITLLVVAVGNNILWDPAMEELSVAEVALAISVSEYAKRRDSMDKSTGRDLRLLSIRTVDPPSRLTPPGVANSENPAIMGSTSRKKSQELGSKSENRINHPGLWRAPIGGTKFGMIGRMVEAVLGKGGVADEVLDGLEGVELT